MDKDLDQFDIDILKQLEIDGKKPFSQIAEELKHLEYYGSPKSESF